MRFVAVVLLILGFVTLDGGLNLLGSPLSFQNLTRNLLPSSSDSAPVAESPQLSTQRVRSPSTLKIMDTSIDLKAPAGKVLTLNLIQLLPDTGTVQVSIPAQEKGSTLFFTCSMGMYTGQIVFE
ncbi:MAG: hypothetical protein IPL71_07415 [Anaerolineales bacterium]|uniref:hypothetical protein n=1 Tax=Candidatus Villigracilis proximus TaxID=3140683 RepID=UPI003136C690|nr:hypothetical protein [Anaerolineales bacterium]